MKDCNSDYAKSNHLRIMAKVFVLSRGFEDNKISHFLIDCDLSLTALFRVSFPHKKFFWL